MEMLLFRLRQLTCAPWFILSACLWKRTCWRCCKTTVLLGSLCFLVEVVCMRDEYNIILSTPIEADNIGCFVQYQYIGKTQISADILAKTKKMVKTLNEKTFPIRRGFEQLSTIIYWWVVVFQSFAKIVAPAQLKGKPPGNCGYHRRETTLDLKC